MSSGPASLLRESYLSTWALVRVSGSAFLSPAWEPQGTRHLHVSVYPSGRVPGDPLFPGAFLGPTSPPSVRRERWRSPPSSQTQRVKHRMRWFFKGSLTPPSTYWSQAQNLNSTLSSLTKFRQIVAPYKPPFLLVPPSCCSRISSVRNEFLAPAVSAAWSLLPSLWLVAVVSMGPAQAGASLAVSGVSRRHPFAPRPPSASLS